LIEADLSLDKYRIASKKDSTEKEHVNLLGNIDFGASITDTHVSEEINYPLNS
jgi:hypothetical protein